MEREKLSSRLGFILISAGCAIGMGNVWKFPYMVGQNGGGIFVLLYLLFLALIGVPILTIEFSLGRAGQKSPARFYQALEPKGSKWHIHGYFAVIGNYVLMMFYTVVASWMLQYFFKTMLGEFSGMDASAIEGVFVDMLAAPVPMTLFTVFITVIGFYICSRGLQNGLEKITNFMMISLIILMAVLAANSIFSDTTGKGLEFYLKPDISKIKEHGFFNVCVNAMNQAFFTLSIGIGSMAIFGSYINKERTLFGEAINVALLDTFVAFTSGLIIFPACFAYGVSPDSGPNLIFITLPNIFNNIYLGRLWGSFFFIFMSFAALSTVLAMFEGLISCTMDIFSWNRKKASIINAVIIIVISMPCILGFNVLSNIEPFGAGSTIMDLEDFIVSNVCLPLGSLVFLLFCVSRYGFGWDRFLAEANCGKGPKFPNWLRGYMTYVLPLIIIVIFIIGIKNFFGL